MGKKSDNIQSVVGKMAMSREDKEQLSNYIKHITIASGLRTFPNGKEMDIRDSVQLNSIGKLLEQIRYYMQAHFFVKETGMKTKKKAFYVIEQARRDLEEIHHGT